MGFDTLKMSLVYIIKDWKVSEKYAKTFDHFSLGLILLWLTSRQKTKADENYNYGNRYSWYVEFL